MPLCALPTADFAAPTPASAAAVFTRNRVVAASVTVARANLRVARGQVRAILINAGNANCATRTGEAVAQISVKEAAKALGIKPYEVLPASTGVIGVELDPAKFVREVRAEMARVTWPSRKETLVTTGLVFAMVALAAMFFFLVDQFIGMGVRVLFGMSV